MIISASRRTDIPSHYSEWFYNRIHETYVLVRNPMNPHQISRVNLSPDKVDGIVFWTKNPTPMIKRLDELEKYTYYFQFTLTPYGEDAEPCLPSKRRVIIPGFIELSNKIGADRVIWRYDPILLSPRYTVQNHIRYFEVLAKTLRGFTKKCIISFVDMYKNTTSNVKYLGLETMKTEDMIRIAKTFSEIAGTNEMELCTCSESIVIFDLKTDKLTHQDIGQMDMYVRMFDDLKREKDDNPTIGIILCTDKDETIVKYSVLNDSKQIFASKYMTVLPMEEELA